MRTCSASRADARVGTGLRRNDDKPACDSCRTVLRSTPYAASFLLPIHVTRMAATRSLTVRLAGLDLPVRTGANDAEIQEIVDLIDARLSEVQKASTTQPLHNNLALVAMSIAQELLAAQQQQEELLNDLDALSQELLDAVDDGDE